MIYKSKYFFIILFFYLKKIKLIFFLILNKYYIKLHQYHYKMAQHLMMAQRGIEDLYEFGHTMEDAIINARVEEIYNNVRNMMRQRRAAMQTITLPVIRRRQPELPAHRTPYASLNPTINKKILTKTELNTHCDEQCSICFDTHLKVDTLTTDCNHQFGTVCYNNWIRRNNNCPICRHTCKSLTIYKSKSYKNEVIELDD